MIRKMLLVAMFFYPLISHARNGTLVNQGFTNNLESNVII
jgi:hypothetical protein